jgi:hypothetical protein
MSLPGVEPGLRPSQSRVPPSHSRDGRFEGGSPAPRSAFRLPPSAFVKSSRMELNHRFLDVSQASLPLDHGTVSNCGSWNRTSASWVRARRHYQQQLPRRDRRSDVGGRIRSFRPPFSDLPNSGSRGTRTHKPLARPPVFETGPSSGRMTSVMSCGGRNRTCDKAVNSRRPVPAQAPPQTSEVGCRRTEVGTVVLEVPPPSSDLRPPASSRRGRI